jgi:8-oxo-dGTP pyrophosphatase MutT (NUDIX family)
MPTVPHLPLPIANERGEVLVAFRDVSEASVSSSGPVVCLMIARHAFGTVLVHNRRRQVWELPGGFADPGETLQDGAVRELREEAGVHATEVHLVGVLEMESPYGHEGHLRCALFRCKVEAATAPSDVEEVDAVTYWDGSADLTPVSAIDAALVRAFGIANAL